MSVIGDLLSQLENCDAETAPFFVRQLLQHEELPNLQGVEALRASRAIAVHAGPQQLPIAGELAGRAHQAGIPAAGALFAECADKVALMSGRPQRFGTVVLEHQGDLVMAPLDGVADDDIRNDFGLPPLVDMRRGIDEQNRTRARDRAQNDGLPPGQKFCRIWSDPTAADLRSGLAKYPEGTWANGDDLTIACQSEAAGIIPVSYTHLTLPTKA